MAQTRAQMVTYVTDKFGVTTSAMTTRAGGFYDARYRMIQDRYLWKQLLVSETSTLAADQQDVTLTSAIDVVIAIRWNKVHLHPVNQEQVFQLNAEAFDGSGDAMGFSVLPKTSAGLSRIRLYETPTQGKELLVLGKAPPETLTDSETPRMTGIDQSLHAYILGDLWQSIRQFGKADVLFKEAEAFLDQMIKIEREQSAYNPQIIIADDGQWDRDDVLYY